MCTHSMQLCPDIYIATQDMHQQPKINGVKEYKVHIITKKTALPIYIYIYIYIYLLITLPSFGGSNIVFSVISKA